MGENSEMRGGSVLQRQLPDGPLASEGESIVHEQSLSRQCSWLMPSFTETLQEKKY